MAVQFKNLFDRAEADACIARIEKLTPETKGLWGQMGVAQMLAHLCVQYEMAFEDNYPKPNFVSRFFINLFVRDYVIGDKPYKKNSPTSKAFKIDSIRNFGKEKARLIAYINQAQESGESFFEGKESNSFGKLAAKQWNTMFSKHNDYHLSQFGV